MFCTIKGRAASNLGFGMLAFFLGGNFLIFRLSIPKCDNRLSCKEPIQDENGQPQGSGWTEMKFNILHLVVMLQKNNILKMFLENKDSVTREQWLGQVKIVGNFENKEKIWMMTANVLHLAAKFNPDGLFLILSSVKEDPIYATLPRSTENSFNSSTSLVADMIFDSHSMKMPGKISPLHVAARNPDSLSTK